MSLMLAEVYEAFKAANVPEDIARKAAEAIAAYTGELADIRSDLKLLKWMVGVLVAMVTALLLKAFAT